MTPQTIADAIERNSLTPTGPGNAFAGYGVIGLPFRSGHVLALRRFGSSSLGPAYTSVWHRDPIGRWTFYSTVAPDCSCARYFGEQIDRNVVTPIEMTWATPWALRVGIGTELTWQLTLRGSPMTRLVNVMASLIPERAYRMPVVLRGMGLAADVALGAGRMNLTGRAPNGHRFVMSPRRLWLIDASTAQVGGRCVGPLGPLEVQAALEDLLIPQRGLFAVATARFERPIHGGRTAARHGTPCDQADTVNGAARQVQKAAMPTHSNSYSQEVVEEPTGARLLLAGRMVSAWGTSPGVWAALRSLAARGRALVIDTCGVTLIDASGIGVLADLIRRWREHGGTTSVVGARRTVAGLLLLSRVGEPGPLVRHALRN